MTIRTLATALLLMFSTNLALALPPGFVLVVEKILNLKARKKEVLHYAFAKGDEITIEMVVTEGNPIREVKFGPYKGSSQYEDYKVKTVTKVIKVQETGIYEFDFSNVQSIGNSIAKVKIQRLPASEETQDFNHHVKLIEKLDTTYIPYQKTVILGGKGELKTVKVLDKLDTTTIPLLDRVERVSSRTKIGGNNFTNLSFTLPPNSIGQYEEIRTVGWSYSIFVEGSGSTWYQKANQLAQDQSIGKHLLAAKLITPGYLALGLLALKGISVFSNPPSGDNVLFEIKNETGRIVAQGNSVTVAQNLSFPNQGFFNIFLENDNIIDGINVKVIVIAVQEIRKYKEKVVKSKHKPIKEKRTFQKPVIKKIMVPVMAN